MVRKVILLLQVLVMVAVYSIGLIVLPTTSHACSCAMFPTVESELLRQTAVFSGKVVEVGKLNTGVNWSSADLIPITFEVDQIWKGEIRKEQIIQTARGGESCGFEFAENQQYLVYANGENNDLKVSLCSRTQVLSESKKDIEALGVAIKSPNEELSAKDQGTDKSIMYYSLGVGMFLIVVLIGIVAIRKKTRS